MTREENKALNCLMIMQIEANHTINRLELKEKYLSLSKEYENDYNKYYQMKEAYDYLYDHVELLNEAIDHLLNPVIEVKEETVSESKSVDIPQAPFNSNNNPFNLPKEPVIIKDRPSLFASLMSILSPLLGFIMFILHRKITPKSSWLYLALAIIGLAINFFVFYYVMGGSLS